MRDRGGLGRRHVFVLWVLLVSLFALAGCSVHLRPDTSTEVALQESVAHIRSTQGEPWGITLPGLAAAAITDPDKPENVIAVTSGASNPPGETPLITADRFHVGSATKTFTAALIMQLEQSNELSLSDPISKWIAYPGGKKVTVAMLLGHTSGLPDFSEMAGRKRSDTLEQSISLAATAKALFHPDHSGPTATPTTSCSAS